MTQFLSQGRWAAGSQLPSSRDLARQFGVSINTVQASLRLLAERDLVELRPRQGCFVKAIPEHSPRSTAARATQIGVIRGMLPDDGGQTQETEHDSWQLTIIRAFEQVMLKDGFHLTMLPYDIRKPDPERQILSRVDALGDQLAGTLCFANQYTRSSLALLSDRNLPWITVNSPTRRSVYNFVAADNFSGGQRVGDYCNQMGIDRVLCLATDQMVSVSNQDRVLGLYQRFFEMRRNTAGIEVLSCDDCLEADGYDAITARLARSNDRPQLIFTSGDLLAIGAMRACREHGLRIPHDIGIIGGTGLLAGAYTHPALTVLAQPMEAMGRHAAHMLIEMIREGIRRMIGRRIPSPMIFRDSLVLTDALRQKLENQYHHELNELQA